MIDSPWPIGDHVLAWIAKLSGALVGLGGALALLWRAWKKIKEVIVIAGRFVQAVEALEVLAVEQAKTQTLVNLICALSDQPFWRTDSQGFLKFANSEYQRMVGRSMDELSGNGWVQVVHHAERHEVVTAWNEAVRHGRDFYSEFTLVHPTQGPIKARAKGFPVTDGRGAVVEYIGSTSRIGT
jgi:PAS domain S-box-containing protein